MHEKQQRCSHGHANRVLEMDEFSSESFEDYKEDFIPSDDEEMAVPNYQISDTRKNCIEKFQHHSSDTDMRRIQLSDTVSID